MSENISIALEGGDGVGKNTLMLSMCELLLQAGVERILVTNYPQYWFFARAIRLMNRGAAESVLAPLPPYRQAQIRAAMYALDRAISLAVLIPLKQQYPEAIHLSDRGPDSNAVTAGYIWANNPELTEADLASFITETITTADQETRNLLNLVSILCVTSDVASSGITERAALDQYESLPAQVRAEQIYRQIIPVEQIVTTRIGNAWQNKTDVAQEAITKAGVNIDITGIACSENQTEVLINGVNDGRIQLIGPLELVHQLIPAELIPTEMQAEYLSIINLAQEWIAISLAGNTINGEVKKLYLDRFETDLAVKISQLIAKLPNLPSQVAIDQGAINAINRLLREYPELIGVIQATIGDEMALFIQKLADLANEI